MNSKKWLYIRLLLVGTGIIQGLRLSPSGFPYPWVISVVLLLLVPLMMVAVIKLNLKRGFIADVLHQPDWDRNPFSLSQPFDFFHVIAWQSIITGIVSGFRVPWVGVALLGQAAVVLSFGFSALLGIKVCENVFRDRFRSEGA